MTYKEKNNLMYPDLTVGNLKKQNPGKFAQMRKQYLKSSKKWLWNSLILKEQLNIHLNEIQQKAEQMISQGMTESEIAEKLIYN
ncbi:MAG: TnpV protein [Clostridia bacterium]|nr:TnpV protein [Clostridia bacterium]